MLLFVLITELWSEYPTPYDYAGRAGEEVRGIIMASQNQPTTLCTESKLRQADSQRQKRQWYIDTALSFKIYRTRFVNLLSQFTKNRLPDTDPRLSSTLAQEIDAWADLETLLLEIPSIANIKAQSAHLPDTGNIQVDLKSEHGNERTTDSHEELGEYQAIHELITVCQGHIREFYHAQRHMPRAINMGALHYFSLAPLCEKSAHGTDKHFPQTRVIVQLDLSLGDTIICE